MVSGRGGPAKEKEGLVQSAEIRRKSSNWRPISRLLKTVGEPAALVYWGLVPPLSAGLGGGGLDGLSSLKIPVILPKKPFFFLVSSPVRIVRKRDTLHTY
jgi:hypothetical protein